MTRRAFELASVDVWDTLLRRQCHPDAVKLHVANVLRECADVAPDSRALLELRLGVEAEQAKAAKAAGFDDEYRHADVLAAWLARAGVPAARREALVRDLAEEEFRHEDFVAYADPGIAAALDTLRARRWVFASDFYMDAEKLFALLQAKGLAGRFADGVSSCDTKLNKRSGRLFEQMHAQFHVAPSQHLHVGDHPVGDVRAPRRLGVQVQPYRPRAEEALRRTRAAWLGQRRKLFANLARDCATAGEGARGVEGEARRVGLSLSPLFAGYAQFIAEQARRKGFERLLFCTREGALFARVYEVLRQAYPRRAASLPEAERFEVSREATFGASLREGSAEELRRLWRAYPNQSVGAFCASLGLDAASLGLAGAAAMTPERLREPALQSALQASIARQRQGLEAYLRSLKLPAGPLGVVDIGWRGSILDNLARFAPDRDWRGLYLGLQEFLEPLPVNARKLAFGPDLNRVPDHAKLFRNLPLLELVCLAPGGTVSGYSAEGAAVRVHKRVDAREDDAYHAVVRSLQEGILTGVATVWAPAIHAQALSADELREPAMACWKRLAASPPRLLRQTLAAHVHDERFGRGRIGVPDAGRGWLARLLS